MTRDWTPTDAAAAADDDRDRNWWRRDPYVDPDYREGPALRPVGASAAATKNPSKEKR